MCVWRYYLPWRAQWSVIIMCHHAKDCSAEREKWHWMFSIYKHILVKLNCLVVKVVDLENCGTAKTTNSIEQTFEQTDLLNSLELKD